MNPNHVPEVSEIGPETGSRFPWRSALLLMAVAAALMVFTTPNELFSRWAFFDSGADLAIQSMIARGLRPSIDFGYIYGLLPLAIGRVWQGLFGATPTACRAATLVCHLALACGLARFASTLRIGPAGILLMVVAMPDMLFTSTVVLVHVLEPALLINALAFQASGRRSTALALATVCLFVKPTMAYLYGLVLVIEIILVERRNAWKTMIPAALTGLGLAALLAILYGPVPLIRTLLPGGGMAVYRAQKYGFFGEAGRQFWILPGAGIRDYFRYEVGGWIVSALLLAIGGLVAAARLLRGSRSRVDGMILVCAILHTGFVLFFFGNRFSWIYYYSVMIAGVAAMAAWGKWPRRLVLAVALIIVAGSKVKAQMNLDFWKINHPRPEMHGLWASDSQLAEWLRVVEVTRDFRPIALLATAEGATVLEPGMFLPADCSYLVEGHTLPAEVRRKADRIASASMVISTRDPDELGFWPEIVQALDGCRTVEKSGMFWILKRDRPPSPAR